MIETDQLIEALQLQPHPEGGWYRETWRGPQNETGRAIGTAILFLLQNHQRSHWHRVDAHEMWIWQAGDPLTLQTSRDDHGPARTITLGSEIASGQTLQGMVEPNQWQAAQPIGGSEGYTLVTCVVTPGFEFTGFELAPPGWQPG